MKKVLAIIFALVMVASLMVGCGGDVTTTTTSTTVADSTTTTTAAAKSSYDEILANAGITHISVVAGENKASFVKAEDGVVEVNDYGYNSEGIVCEIIETIYMPFGDTYTPDYADTLDEVMEQEYAHLDSIDCASVESSFADNVYVLTIKYTGLDNLDNIRALHDAEVFNEAFSYYNMADAAAEQIGKGFVQK